MYLGVANLANALVARLDNVSLDADGVIVVRDDGRLGNFNLPSNYFNNLNQ